MTTPAAESDPRFPSGKWVGFFLDKRMPGKHQMELTLSFADGDMTGSGRDRVGSFVIDGEYDLTNGKCRFEKRYVNAHTVHYTGFNEGKGIWGTWEMNVGGHATGGFLIWPEGMSDPSVPVMEEEADPPTQADVPGELELEPVGT